MAQTELGKMREAHRKELAKKRRFLKAKEMQTIQNYSKSMKEGTNKSLSQCAKDAGYSANYAPVAARIISEGLSKNDAFREIMERHGLSLEVLAEDIGSLRKAELPSGHPDNFIRFKNVELRSKLHDVVPSQKIEETKRSISIHITADTLGKIRELKGDAEFKRLTGKQE